MTSRKKQDSSHLSILEAVEALESIADLEFPREVDLATEEEINEQNHLVTARAVKWLGKEDPDGTVKLIQDTFHVVLDYLKRFYKSESMYIGKPQLVEGVKTIMVLIGETAQKLDKYTTLFQHTKSKSVKRLKEYKQLQEFYLTRIAKKIDQGILGKWILELTKGAIAKREIEKKLKRREPITAKYVFIDLDSVKKDAEYELFFLRKEDGSRFFNPRLIRNIKLVCDFGETIRQEALEDPLRDVRMWQDFAMHTIAKNIIMSMGGAMDRYLREAGHSWKREMVAELNKAIMALYLCSNPRNLLRNSPVKSCSEYFMDFQGFLRNALKSNEYQRLLVYPPKKTARLTMSMLDVTHHLCRALFTSVTGLKELLPVFEKVFNEAEQGLPQEHDGAGKGQILLWSSLEYSYAALKQLLKQHPHGPLVKVLEILEQGMYHMFDPIGQSNVPSQLYNIFLKEHKMTNIRLPTPTCQEFIHKADVLEEFKGMLRASSKGNLKRKHLLINLQDRTSWKEHVRCLALEELGGMREFSTTLSVVTLAKDTEFYHQAAPYHEDHQAESFIQHFKEQLADEHCGFFFPESLKKKLFSQFIDQAIEGVHKVFFGGMNVLTANNRRDFIEIFYLFLQLKLLDLLQPDSFSLTCKDAIDAGVASSLQIYCFLMILREKGFEKNEIEHVNYMLHHPALLFRERTLLRDKFERMLSTLKRIETTRAEMGKEEFQKVIQDVFGNLYKTPILKSSSLSPVSG